jgi:hypothetical protein
MLDLLGSRWIRYLHLSSCSSFSPFLIKESAKHCGRLFFVLQHLKELVRKTKAFHFLGYRHAVHSCPHSAANATRREY